MARSIINENRESKNINLARKLCKSNGYSDADAQRIVDAVRTDIPNSRLFQCKFLAGVTRMYIQGQIRESSDIMKLNQCLKFIGAHLNEYDSNLNGMSAQEVINRFSTMAAQDLQNDMARSNSTEYNENKSYRIVRINAPDDAEPYSQYTEWCVTDPESGMYNNYTSGGLGLFYFCLRDGFENVPMEKGENCPLDEYGLSMIAVSVNEDGSCNTITCRWNHDNGGNDHVMTVEQLEQLLGRRFYQTFKPRTKEELKRMRMEMLDDIAYQAYGDMCNCGIGDDAYFEPLFNEDDEESDSLELYAYSSNCGYDGYEGEAHYIIVDRNVDPVIEDLFDYVYYENGSVIVCKNRKYNILVNKSETMMDLRYISDEWYRKILPTPVKGCFYVMNDDKLFNLVSVYSDGVLFGEWYDSIELYRNSHENGTAFAIIQKNRGFNIVTFNGTAVGRPMFQKWRSGIAIGPGGIFIEATQEGSSSPLVNGKPMELYAMNFDKFPYTATQLDGWERGLYKIECEDRIVYVDDDTRNGWKIMAVKEQKRPSGEDNTQYIAENVKQKGRNIIITESMAEEIEDMLYPTPFKFTGHLKKFLAGILEDPCGTEVGEFFSGNGITKDLLLKSLMDLAIIKRHMDIDDHDADGNPHTAKMIVRYTVPKSHFNDKVKELFNELFPDGGNVKMKVNEEGGGATSCSGVDGNGFGSGEFVQPLFGTVASKGSIYNPKPGRKKRKKVDESVSEVRDSDTSSAVYIYAKDNNGEWNILCARRLTSKNMDEGGKWNPPMGHRHVHETFKDCARRECMEESGLDIARYADSLIAAQRYDWGVEYVLPIREETTDEIRMVGGGDGENTKFVWMPVRRISGLDWAWSCKEHAVNNFRKFVVR